MNQRITELMLEAGRTIPGNKHIDADFCEKFAELIVKECVRHFNEDYQRDFDTLWREDLSQSIKEHFWS